MLRVPPLELHRLGCVARLLWRPEPGQRGIMGGAEQLPLFDSPVSGMVLATHEGAQQECNRPDQLWQCRYHCYSDLGFLRAIGANVVL